MRTTRVRRSSAQDTVVRRFTPTGALLSEFALPRDPFCDDVPACGAASARTAASSTWPRSRVVQSYGVLRLDAATGTELGRFAQTDPAGLGVRVRGGRRTRRHGVRVRQDRARPARPGRGLQPGRRLPVALRSAVAARRLRRGLRTDVAPVRAGSARRVRSRRHDAALRVGEADALRPLHRRGRAGGCRGRAAGRGPRRRRDPSRRRDDLRELPSPTASRSSTSTAASAGSARRCSGGSPSAATGAASGT